MASGEYAAEQAARRSVPVGVVFTLPVKYLGAGARQYGFMLRGLRSLAASLKERNIEFILLE
eukprot:4946386-Pyramimonas_sp.AAC.1